MSEVDSDLLSYEVLTEPKGSVDGLMETYNTGVRHITNDKAPTRSRTITLRTEACLDSKRLRFANSFGRR